MTTIVTSQVKEKSKGTNYLREVQQELVKVSWTTKEELLLCTKIVIGSTFLFGLAVYFSDLVIRGVLDLIFFMGKLIGG
jgi:preprotein translocase subunit SecE